MGLHFLIVDDSDLNLTVLSSLLRKNHVSCDCVSSAIEAYSKLECVRYDLIFMDYMMPDVNGIEASEYIRNMVSASFENKYYEDIPIVILTAEENFDFALGTTANIRDFLTKPCTSTKLMAMVGKYFPNYNPADEIPLLNADVVDGIDADPKECLDYLEIFINTCDNIALTIKMAVHISDFTTFTIEVHRLKGEAQIISATKLANLAKMLEAAGKSILKTYDNGKTEAENIEFIRDNTPLLLSTLDKLKNDIENYKNANGITKGTAKPLNYEQNHPPVKNNEESTKLIISVQQRDKAIRYLNYAIESIDAGDAQNARSWLEGIIDLLS